ncbi:MAG: polysaccharide deacetylase family protein [bacterium]|nr:polysaccharide deacetylase family protein [bacterium]
MNDDTTEIKLRTPSIPQNGVMLSVDVEDYFMSPETIAFADWPKFESAIHRGMEKTLALFDRFGAKATFFFVAWLADRYPELVRWTVERGHEIGSHSYTHNYIHQMEPREFEATLEKSLAILQPLAGEQPIIGFRAPAFSLDRKKEWQFSILKKRGFRYDSSIIPVQTYLYGDRTAPRHPYWIGDLFEIPPATIEIAGWRQPVGGGGTLRLYPAWFTTWARRRYQAEGYPPVIYLHPWELVPDHPPIPLPFKQRFMHYAGIRSMESKLAKLLQSNHTLTLGDYWRRVMDDQ